MPSLGPAEILVILVVALLVFGPNKMPEIARQVGRGMREFRRVQQHLSTELRDVVSEFDGSNDSTVVDTAPPPGDPVPTLPPRVDAEGPERNGAAPAETPQEPTGRPDATVAPLTPVAPVVPPVSDGSADTPRGQRVWQPPTPPAV